MTKVKIKEIVNNLIYEYGTNNPEELCNYLGINIQKVSLINGLALSFETNNQKTIIINSKIKKGIFRDIVLGHELGHCLIHDLENALFIKSNFINSTDRQEKEANIFTSELLLSNKVCSEYKEIFEEYNSKNSVGTLAEIINDLEIEDFDLG